MAAPVNVFVYGTLRAGEPNDINRLSPRPRFLGFGVVEGDLFDFGRHPGIVLRDGASRVLGELYACAPELIRTLDDIELSYPDRPGMYRAAWREVACAGRTVRCLVYELTDEGASSLGRFPTSELVDWVSWRLRKAERRPQERGAPAGRPSKTRTSAPGSRRGRARPARSKGRAPPRPRRRRPG
jgi:gamma-glutamylcyclotransferase (GGCT)/AIG2-like uncharacterized protein YtfP